jgi:hypothetical protein
MLIDECMDRPIGYVKNKSALYTFLMLVSLTRILSQLLTSSCMHDAGLLLEPTPGAGALNTII